MRGILPSALLVTVLWFSGASGGAAATKAGPFVPAGARLVAQCHATAQAVGYPVPCPMQVPRGIRESTPIRSTGCVLHVIGPGGRGGCAKSWRGWVVGSSATAHQHLVITASPRRLANDAKVVNGPAWYPQARVERVGTMTINGWRMRAVFVPKATNDGSALADHVVLIWNAGRHTYAVGFHNVTGVRKTLRLDVRLVRSIRLVSPA